MLHISIFVIIAALAIYIPSTFYGHYYEWLHFYHDSVETLSFMAVITSAIFVYWQIVLFIRDYRNKNQRAEYAQSYEMAKFYAENLLTRMTTVGKLLNKINRANIPEYKLKYASICTEMHKFSYKEAITILPKDYIDNFSKHVDETLTIEEMIFFFASYNHKTSLEVRDNWNKFLYGKSNYDKESFYKDKRTILKHSVADVFNDLEYFSMIFCSGLAVPENVYASLHQTFIQFVQIGYPYIATHNRLEGHEFYTHIIRLYKHWVYISSKNDFKIILRLLCEIFRLAIKESVVPSNSSKIPKIKDKDK